MKTPACPTCYAETGQLFALISTMGGNKCSHNITHNFTDTAELMAMNPPMIEQPSKLAPQPAPLGSVNLQLAIPGEVKVQLDSRFGIRLNQTLVALASSLIDPDAFVMGKEDVFRILEKTGQKVNTGAKVFGLISDLVTEKIAAEESAKLAKGKPSQSSETGISCTGFTKLELDHLKEKALKLGAAGPERLIEAVVKQAIKKGLI